jgi:hypothetical protein
MYPDSEILFPPSCILGLRDLRGPEWAELIDRVSELPDQHEDVLGLSLLVINLSSCLTCDLDSYRASLGCCVCAKRTVAGYKGSDRDLIREFEEAREDVRQFLESSELTAPISEIVKRPS